MPAYVAKQLLRYEHPHPTKPQHCPYNPNPIKYGQDNQATDPFDTSPSPKLNEANKKCIQQFVGSFLYYAHAVDPTILMVLSAIASQQALPNKDTHNRVNQFLGYMATILMPIYDIALPTWYSMCTPMPCISVHLMSEVTQVATSSLAVPLVMDLQFKSMVLCTSHAQFSNWWRPPWLKQSLGHSSSIHNRPTSCNLSLKNLVVHNHQLPYTLTTPLDLALLTTPSNNNVHKLWK